MITLKNIRFKNILAYKDEQVFDFTKDRVVLLEGAVGAGKSSISTILEEVLYNKNSRDFAKGDLLNRYSNEKSYQIVLNFSDDISEYTITKKVASTAKVTITKDGTDISGHTATQTYEIIKNIIGMDFNTFSKTIYQSLKSSMDFLTVTDANRKKFLIDMFGLHIYDSIDEKLKETKKSIDSQITKLSDNTNKNLLEKLSKNAIKQEVLPVPEIIDHTEEIDAIKEKITLVQHHINSYQSQKNIVDVLEKSLKDLESSMKKDSDKLNKYGIDKDIKELQVKELEEWFQLNSAVTNKSEELQSITREYDLATSTKEKLKKEFNDLKETASIKHCPACNQPIDNSAKLIILEGIRAKFNIAKNEAAKFLETKSILEDYQDKYKTYSKNIDILAKLTTEIKQISEKIEELINKYKTDSTKLTELSESLGKEKDKLKTYSNLESTAEYKIKLDSLVNETSKSKQEYDKVTLYNAKAEAHNASIESTLTAIKDLETTIKENDSKLKELLDSQAHYEILIKANKDLISYKLESSVKVFEKYINEYLTELSGGKLALAFSMDNTKLSIDVYNKGIQCSIKTLSSGQQTSVNIATLLAIRNTMAKISKNSINFLFLDEVVSTLDENLKLELIEILAKEPYLNTTLVSHGFSHPLATTRKVVVDANGFSRIL